MKQNETGSCQCGNVRYEVRGNIKIIYVCHCLECRKQSASAFGVSVIVPSKWLTIVQGELSCWARSANSGRTIDCFFCPKCGSRVWHRGRETPETTSIKGGSLDYDVDLSKAIHIWTSRKLPGVIIPASAQEFSSEPE